jgi:hypothetical protein
VGVLPVVDEPGQVTGRQAWVEHAVERRCARADRVHLLDADDQPAVDIESEPAGDRRPGAVGTDREPCGDPRHRVRDTEADPRACLRGRRQRVRVDARHVADPELVARADQLDRRAQRRRVEQDPAHRWAEVVRRQREVLERAPHEDAGGPDAGVETGAALAHEDVEALQREQPRRVQTRQPGTDHEHIHHHGSSITRNLSNFNR